MEGALRMFSGMVGLSGFNASDAPYISNQQLLCLPLLAALCWLSPNAYQIMGHFSPALQKVSPVRGVFGWKPSLLWAACLGVLAALCISQMLSGAPSEFIYFQF